MTRQAHADENRRQAEYPVVMTRAIRARMAASEIASQFVPATHEAAQTRRSVRRLAPQSCHAPIDSPAVC